jgi:hypothetical protein
MIELSFSLAFILLEAVMVERLVPSNCIGCYMVLPWEDDLQHPVHSLCQPNEDGILHLPFIEHNDVHRLLTTEVGSYVSWRCTLTHALNLPQFKKRSVDVINNTASAQNIPYPYSSSSSGLQTTRKS